MKKQDYLDTLKNALTKLKVSDVGDIVSEYSDHFDFKLADGYTEEEIAAKLGTPQEVAAQYSPAEEAAKPGKNNIVPLIYTGVISLDIFIVLPFFAMFAAWIVTLFGTAIAFLGGAVMLTFGIQIANVIPAIPFINSLLFALPCFFLSLMCIIGTVQCSLYIKQIFKAYARWHKNVIAGASGKPVLPSLSMHPQLNPRVKRRLRNLLMISIIGFGITIVVAYAAAAISAGAIEFWHAWNWFE